MKKIQRSSGSVLLLALLCWLLAASSPAVQHGLASPLFETIGGLTGHGAFTGRAGQAGAASAYFNPARLMDAEPGVSVGLFALHEGIGMQLEGRPASAEVGADLARYVHGSDGSVIQISSFPSSWLRDGCPEPTCRPALSANPRQSQGSSGQNRTYGVLGVVSRMFSGRASFGLYAMAPLNEVTAARSFFNDQNEQFFSDSLHPELYGDRLTATSFALGVATEPWKGFALGIALTLSLQNVARAQTYVRGENQEQTLLLASDVSVRGVLSPHLSLRYQALPALALSATLHSAQRFDIETSFQNMLGNGNVQTLERLSTHAYLPWQLGLGADYGLLPATSHHRLALVAQLLFGRWSRYVDRQGQAPLPGYAWSDTLGYSAGLRYGVGSVTTSLDGTLRLSPAPEQKGRGNHVDNDRVGLAGAVRYQFELLGSRFDLGFQLQAHRLFERSHQKNDLPASGTIEGVDRADCALPSSDCYAAYNPGSEVLDELPDDAVDPITGQNAPGREGLQTNNPGYPGFSSEGWLLGGGATLRLHF